MEIEVEVGHHEVAPSQHEIDLKYTDALGMADACITYRYVVKEIARQHGVYATFMPKPIFGENGSGMHVHQSLFQGERTPSTTRRPLPPLEARPVLHGRRSCATRARSAR